MQIIPAIDIRGGNCVRLMQGRLEQETIYSKDPVFMAKLWRAKGAERIHIVDLDGAFGGVPANYEIIKSIRKEVDVALEVGGGIRDHETIEKLLNAGIDKVVLGTVAIYNTDLVKEAIKNHGDKIIIGIDANNGRAAIGGWKEVTNVTDLDLAHNMEKIGVSEFIYTDISKDGMLEGPNLGGVKKFAESIKGKMIVSGGIASVKDIENIVKLKMNNIDGIIVGKALYAETLKLEDAIAAVK
ncbi:MAG: 1-(5-phosphoribosyl)-5-[(5-phosphoribosylamino)methylideneamino]imidazole-4-carboxamide isomerase [Elusimicrobiota bacterium]